MRARSKFSFIQTGSRQIAGTLPAETPYRALFSVNFFAVPLSTQPGIKPYQCPCSTRALNHLEFPLASLTRIPLHWQHLLPNPSSSVHCVRFVTGGEVPVGVVKIDGCVSMAKRYSICANLTVPIGMCSSRPWTWDGSARC